MCRSPDDIWKCVIILASFVCCAVIDGMCSMFGVLLPYLVVHFRETTSKTSLAGSVFGGLYMLSGFVSSACINIFGYRWTTSAGGLISAAAFFGCAWSPNIDIFILIFGGLGGFGFGLVYLPATVMLGHYFDEQRGLAAGLACAGAGAGVLILSPLAGLLVESFGWRGCLMIMAGVNLQCVVCGFLMGLAERNLKTKSKHETLQTDDIQSQDRNGGIPMRHGEDNIETRNGNGDMQNENRYIHIENYANRDTTTSGDLSRIKHECRLPFAKKLQAICDVSLLINWSFILISVASACIQLGFFVPIMFLTSYTELLGMTVSQGAKLLSIMGGSNMLGRAFFGFLASRKCVNVLHMNSLCLVGSALSMLYLVHCTTFEMLVVFSIIFGFIFAAFLPVTTIFLVKYISLQKFTNAYGLLCTIKGISTIFGPPIAGSLYDVSRSFDQTFYFAGSMFLAAGIIFYFLPFTQNQSLACCGHQKASWKPHRKVATHLHHEYKFCYCGEDLNEMVTNNEIILEDKIASNVEADRSFTISEYRQMYHRTLS